MKVGSQSFAECQYVEGHSPIWSGSQPLHPTEHPLLALLEVDSIYPPHVFFAALEAAWRSWRNNELTDLELQAELDQLFRWVDTTTASLPRTKFWRRNL